MKPHTLNLFYEEPDPDRWFPGDRYPRRALRRIIRGSHRPGGQMRVFLNLSAGLDKLGVKYRINDYRYIKSHPEEVACIVGKPFVLDKIDWRNPILFGAAIHSHPLEDPELLERLPIRKVVVPGEWMRAMCEPYWKEKVMTWPVGINTEIWSPVSEDLEINVLKSETKKVDFLIYDKVRWEHDRYERELIQPIRDELKKQRLSWREIRYGFYQEEDFHQILSTCRGMIFLCEHETQGIAYQQALSCGVPILAWDRGGYWQDPYYYPHKVKFSAVSSVPYWDSRCGIKFRGIKEFSDGLNEFLSTYEAGEFHPRDYILENLTLEKCAAQYLKIVKDITS